MRKRLSLIGVLNLIWSMLPKWPHFFFQSSLCKGYYLVLNSSFKVAKEGDRLIALNLTVLDWCSAQMIVQLHGKDGGSSTFILRALITCSLNRQTDNQNKNSVNMCCCICLHSWLEIKLFKFGNFYSPNHIWIL